MKKKYINIIVAIILLIIAILIRIMISQINKKIENKNVSIAKNQVEKTENLVENTETQSVKNTERVILDLPKEKEEREEYKPPRTVTYLDNYEIKGTINIPKINCNYPILEKVTVDSLSKSVAILDIFSMTGEKVQDLNVPGSNVIIYGHNYRNGMFFSNNYKLSEGDIIQITDQFGITIDYEIYNIYYTTPEDASFMVRDIDLNSEEITLQTCNDDSSKRLIICAKNK